MVPPNFELKFGRDDLKIPANQPLFASALCEMVRYAMIDDLSNALLFAGALLLGLALIFSVFLPRVVFHLRPRRRRHIDPGFWYGHGFDTSGITPKLQEVRQDYVAEVKARGHVTEYGATLLASACEAVRKLAFFRDRTSNEQQ